MVNNEFWRVIAWICSLQYSEVGRGNRSMCQAMNLPSAKC